MICKDNQQLIDSLLRLKSNEDLCVRAINQVMKDNNKIASVQSEPENKTNKKGELKEFIGLLKRLTH